MDVMPAAGAAIFVTMSEETLLSPEISELLN
jgi:hypothetical protein